MLGRFNAMPTRPEGTLGDPAQHPYIQDSSCPICQASPGRLALRTDYVLYLRCERCFNTWTQPERRARKRLDNTTDA